MGMKEQERFEAMAKFRALMEQRDWALERWACAEVRLAVAGRRIDELEQELAAARQAAQPATE